MTSLAGIVKAEAVRLDKDNVVSIEAPVPVYETADAAEAMEAAEPPGAETEPPPEAAAAASETILAKARAEADDIIKRAQAGAQTILGEAQAKSHAEIAQVLEKSKSEGYQAGYQEGLSETEEIRKNAKAELEGAVKEKNKLIGEAEGEIVDMIVKISEKLVSGAAAINPGVVQNLVRQGFSGVSAAGDMVVRVSPADYQALTGNKERVIPQELSSSKVEFRRDDAMKQGECVIETPLGNIDCGLGQQFEGLRNDLYHLMNTS